MNFILLKAEIDSKDKFNDIDIITELNLKNIDVVQDIRTVDIKKYLIVKGKILAIKASSEPFAMLTMEALNAFDTFDMSDQANITALNAQISGLIEAGLLDLTDKAVILSLGVKQVSRGEQLGFNNVDQGHIDAARSL